MFTMKKFLTHYTFSFSAKYGTKMLLHFTNMHTTEFRIEEMQRDYACNVEATEIQAHISGGNSLCADSYPTISHFCLLGIW